VNDTASADHNAAAPAGTINLKNERAFGRKGRRNRSDDLLRRAESGSVAVLLRFPFSSPLSL
jgi:hypothetical protein